MKLKGKTDAAIAQLIRTHSPLSTPSQSSVKVKEKKGNVDNSCDGVGKRLTAEKGGEALAVGLVAGGTREGEEDDILSSDEE